MNTDFKTSVRKKELLARVNAIFEEHELRYKTEIHASKSDNFGELLWSHLYALANKADKNSSSITWVDFRHDVAYNAYVAWDQLLKSSQEHLNPYTAPTIAALLDVATKSPLNSDNTFLRSLTYLNTINHMISSPLEAIGYTADALPGQQRMLLVPPPIDWCSAPKKTKNKDLSDAMDDAIDHLLHTFAEQTLIEEKSVSILSQLEKKYSGLSYVVNSGRNWSPEIYIDLGLGSDPKKAIEFLKQVASFRESQGYLEPIHFVGVEINQEALDEGIGKVKEAIVAAGLDKRIMVYSVKGDFDTFYEDEIFSSSEINEVMRNRSKNVVLTCFGNTWGNGVYTTDNIPKLNESDSIDYGALIIGAHLLRPDHLPEDFAMYINSYRLESVKDLSALPPRAFGAPKHLVTESTIIEAEAIGYHGEMMKRRDGTFFYTSVWGNDPAEFYKTPEHNLTYLPNPDYLGVSITDEPTPNIPATLSGFVSTKLKPDQVYTVFPKCGYSVEDLVLNEEREYTIPNGSPGHELSKTMPADLMSLVVLTKEYAIK